MSPLSLAAAEVGGLGGSACSVEEDEEEEEEEGACQEEATVASFSSSSSSPSMPTTHAPSSLAERGLELLTRVLGEAAGTSPEEWPASLQVGARHTRWSFHAPPSFNRD